ncbi:MAG: dihydrodipicolinate reductase C-terminal domain-containing protein [Sphingomicrobium sp.]
MTILFPIVPTPWLRGRVALGHDTAMRTKEQTLRITLFAPDGRLGRAIAAAVAADPAFALDPDHGDVLVDFSAPSGLQESLDRAVSAGIPILVGTTGLDNRADTQIAAAAERVAVLRAANTSLGIAVLADLIERAAKVLGPDWDIAIQDIHHAKKVDAPSGTALALGEAASRGRDSSKIHYASIRGGTVAGDHDVLFLGPEERVILSHRAESRAIFARGALAAARFLAGRPAGLYSMRDVIDSL